MKKLMLFFSLVCAGLMTSCVDKYEEVDADSNPSWLGGSIYESLKNPNQSLLTGTFTNYLRLVDDLDYTDVLNKTGSKTVFPANDEAFARFFQSNDWGVTSYDQLTFSQKKLLLYTSMLDNALLINMLSNVENSGEIVRGMAVKHESTVNVIDSISHVYGAAYMPRNNKYWTKFYNTGIDYVSDATKPMLVHFTREQMVNNSITTAGENSDFQIITGSPYTEGSAFVFRDEVVNSDVTCQNGYIHQLKDVLVPPGNMAELLRKNGETDIFSRMVDYFSAPFYDAVTTNNYNDWAIANGKDVIDSIYQVRYFSSKSQGNTALVMDADGKMLTDYLNYDPGWNQYFPSNAYSSSPLMDMGAIFAPNDAAMKKFFLPGGDGSYLLDLYGSKSNTEANLLENIDSLYSKKSNLVKKIVNNLMKSSFVETVPSKFTTITNDASDNMGMNLSYLNTASDGSYDVKIANNGVVYVINSVIAPDELISVMAPASTYPDMQVMNWAVSDGTYLGVDFQYYLLAMSANYAFFIPDDEAFGGSSTISGSLLNDCYYIDPVSLAASNGTQPVALHFYYDATVMSNNHLRCDRYKLIDGTWTYQNAVSSISSVKTQLVDLLNYHTVVLNPGETIGSNHYYKTKHGAEIYVSGGNEGNYVASGAQIDNGYATSKIETDYSEKNGHAYRLDHVIQSTQNSVYKVLSSNSRFSEFYDACSGFTPDNELLSWAGISTEANSVGVREIDAYTVFTNQYGVGTSAISNACIDYNVKFFNTYNYTLYAPDNTAMEKAHQEGLPTWDDITNLYETYGDDASDDIKAQAKAMIVQLRNFVRYHFQTVSLYADNSVESGEYQTMCTDDLGISLKLTVSSASGNGNIVVVDAAGVQHTISNSNGMMVNKMARDMWLGDASGSNVVSSSSAAGIYTSSFCAIHEISEPLYNNASKNFGVSVSSAKGVRKSSMKR